MCPQNGGSEMKKIKVSEATNIQLDWLVAKCEGHQWRCPWMLEKDGYAAWMSYERAWGSPTPEYTTDWSQMGPIIERVVLSLIRRTDGQWTADNFSVMTRPQHLEFGPTALIAAARCYVMSKLGEEVEVPEELT